MDALLERLKQAVERRGAEWPGHDAAIAAVVALSADLSADLSDLSADPSTGADEVAPKEGHDLATIASRFGLSQVESDLLEVAATAEQSTAAHLLLGLLAGDGGPGRPTVALGLELSGAAATGSAARVHLGELSRLIRFGLVQLQGNDVLLSRRLVLPERIASFLAGGGLPPAYLLPVLLDAVPIEVEGTSVVSAALARGHRLVWIHAPFGGAGAAMATAACRELGVTCLVADLSRLTPTVPADEAVAALLLECGLEGMVLVLVGAEAGRNAALMHAAVPVLAVSTEPWNPQWSTELPLAVSAPRMSVAERGNLWGEVLAGEPVESEITAMPLSPEQIVTVARHARQMAELHGESGVSTERIRTSVRQFGRGRSIRSNPAASASLDDLVLSGHALEEIQRLLDWARFRDEVIGLGPLHGKGGKGTGICALFSGPPGTGKTLAAHVIADSLGMDLYQIELSSIVDKYIGETEKNLEKVFTEAESMHAVLFFDEADSLFGSRSEVKDARDRYANQEVAYLLQRMEQFDGITVLASNLRGNIDPAFARRLHFIVSFPDPDPETRLRLWTRHLQDLGGTDPDDPIDVDELANSVEVSGGDIRNIVLSSAYAAVAEGSKVGSRHIAASVRREYIKLGRLPGVRIDASDDAMRRSSRKSNLGA
jgi:DNA polymerase III delta prime subunit